MSHPLRPLIFALALAGTANTTLAMDLLDAVRLAEQKDPRFAAIKASRNIADKTPDIARAALLPQVSLGGTFSTNTLTQDKTNITFTPPGSRAVSLPFGGESKFNSTELSARVIQPIFNLAAFNQYDAAQAQRSRDQATAEEQYQGLKLKIAEAYFAVLRSEAALDLARSRENTLSKRFENTRERLAVGFVPQLDLIESEAQRDLATSERLTAENSYNTAREALSAAVGQGVDDMARLRDNMPVVPPTPSDPQSWAGLALRQNPALAAARYDITASEANLAALRTSFLPTVNLFATLSDRSNSGSNSLAVTLNAGTTTVLGVEARWDIFSGGRTAATERQATHQAELVRQNLKAAEQAVQNQTKSLFMTVRNDAARLQANRRQVISAERTYDAIETGYQSGTHNIIDLTTAEAKRHAARLEYTNTRFDYLIDSLRLHASAGMLGNDVIARYNESLGGTYTPPSTRK